MDDFVNHCLKVTVAQLCQSIGWDAIQSSPLDLMVDVAHRYMHQLAIHTHQYSEQFGRTQPTLDDLGLSFRDMGIRLNDLEEYVQCVEPATFPTSVPSLPLPKQSRLNFLKPGSREVVRRPVHVHEHLPAMHPEMEEDDYQSNHLTSSLMADATADGQSPAPRVSDAFVNESPSLKRARLLLEEEGHPMREISSVMMTTSGFISPAVEGKLPEAKPPPSHLLQLCGNLSLPKKKALAADAGIASPKCNLAPPPPKKSTKVSIKRILEGANKIDHDKTSKKQKKKLLAVKHHHHHHHKHKINVPQDSAIMKLPKIPKVTKINKADTDSIFFSSRPEAPVKPKDFGEREEGERSPSPMSETFTDSSTLPVSSEDNTAKLSITPPNQQKLNVFKKITAKVKEETLDAMAPSPVSVEEPVDAEREARLQSIDDAIESVIQRPDPPVEPEKKKRKKDHDREHRKVAKRDKLPQMFNPPTPYFPPPSLVACHGPSLIPAINMEMFGSSSKFPQPSVMKPLKIRTESDFKDEENEHFRKNASSISPVRTKSSSLLQIKKEPQTSVSVKEEMDEGDSRNVFKSIPPKSEKQSPGITATVLSPASKEIKTGKKKEEREKERSSSKERRKRKKEKRDKDRPDVPASEVLDLIPASDEKERRKKEKRREKERMKREKAEKKEKKKKEKAARAAAALTEALANSIQENMKPSPSMKVEPMSISPNSSSSPVPKITFKLGAGPKASPNMERKVMIKHMSKKEKDRDQGREKESVSGEGSGPWPELARFSALVTRPPKQKPSPSSEGQPSPTGSLKVSARVSGTVPPPPPQQPSPVVKPSVAPLPAKTSPVGIAIPKKKGAPRGRKKLAPTSPTPSSSALISQTLGFYMDSAGNKVWICPACGRQDDGSPMIGCDSCDDWYHWVCVGIQVPPAETEDWYCVRCISQQNNKSSGPLSDKKKHRKKK